jgi:hypothetical protein
MLGSKKDMLVVAVPDLSLVKEPSRESKRAKQAAFWFLLVDSETGELYKGAGIDAVSLSPDTDIIQFRKLVHLKNPNKLGGINASNLLVYKNKVAFDARNDAKDDGKEQVLDPTESIGMLGSKEDMLVVAVPDLSLIKGPSRKRKQRSNEHNKILGRILENCGKGNGRFPNSIIPSLQTPFLQQHWRRH